MPAPRTMQVVPVLFAALVVGVPSLEFEELGRMGLRQLAAYVGVVLFGLAIQMFVVYSLLVHFLGGMSPWAFFSGSRLAIVTAFSTASSSATLPTALRMAEESLRLPPAVSRFVLTAGSTMNQNGTAPFEGVAVLFLAQLCGNPLEGLGLILGVDRLLDMARTTVNVTGDLAAAVYVARGARAGGEASKS